MTLEELREEMKEAAVEQADYTIRISAQAWELLKEIFRHSTLFTATGLVASDWEVEGQEIRLILSHRASVDGASTPLYSLYSTPFKNFPDQWA